MYKVKKTNRAGWEAFEYFYKYIVIEVALIFSTLQLAIYLAPATKTINGFLVPLSILLGALILKLYLKYETN